MERRDFLISSALGAAAVSGLPVSAAAHSSTTPLMSATSSHDTQPPTRKILIAGGGFDTSYIRYMAQLSGKARPRICYLPTASADDQDGIIRFYQQCAPLAVEPFVQPSFIESLSQTQGWDEVFLSMDGIVVSGGNTLNQQAIWKAQGIDVVLRQAWERGIVLGGASAGSLCWFEEGTTDSRPKALSIVKCLGFLPGSHSPHYDSEPGRRPLYQRLIGAGEMKPGYAVDDNAGLYFEGTTLKRVVTARRGAQAYQVRVEGGRVVETALTPEWIGG
jgi:peptidase E